MESDEQQGLEDEPRRPVSHPPTDEESEAEDSEGGGSPESEQPKSKLTVYHIVDVGLVDAEGGAPFAARYWGTVKAQGNDAAREAGFRLAFEIRRNGEDSGELGAIVAIPDSSWQPELIEGSYEFKITRRKL
jgi:hypothetical protein